MSLELGLLSLLTDKINGTRIIWNIYNFNEIMLSSAKDGDKKIKLNIHSDYYFQS